MLPDQRPTTASPLIHDRDPLSTRVFGEILTGGGVQPIRLPPQRPNLNASAERFVRSIKEECLSCVVPAWRGSCAPARPRVRRTLPSREKPSGPRQPTPAAAATAGQHGRRRGAAGAPRRTSQLLLPRGRTRGRLIICTLRGRAPHPLTPPLTRSPSTGPCTGRGGFYQG